MEARAEIKTAAAAVSLAILARSRISGLTKSTSASKEVFTSSSIRTSPIVKTKIAHSIAEKFKISAGIMTMVATIRWILKFGSPLKASLMPAKANLKLLLRRKLVDILFKYTLG